MTESLTALKRDVRGMSNRKMQKSKFGQPSGWQTGTIGADEPMSGDPIRTSL